MSDKEVDPLEESRKFWRDIDAKSDAIDEALERLIPGYKAPTPHRPINDP